MASSGSIVAYNQASSHKTACWSFEWTAGPTGTPGQTLVSWNLYTRGRSSTPTQLTTNCTFKLWYNNAYQHQVTYKDMHGEDLSFNDKWREGGSFIVNHAADGSANFRVHLSGYIWDTSAPFKVEQYAYLDTNYNGQVKIYTNGQWKNAIPYVYTNGTWKQVIPYVYTGNQWKIST